MNWLIIICGILFNTAASVLIKIAMASTERLSFDIPTLLTLMANITLWLGVICYGGAFILYAVALAKFPLNVAHPILTSGAIACVAMVSVWLFNEPLPLSALLGIILIIIGVALIAMKFH